VIRKRHHSLSLSVNVTESQLTSHNDPSYPANLSNRATMAKVARIPIIDLNYDDQDEAQRVRVAKDLVEAAVEHGFIYIKNTGTDIPVSAVDDAFTLVLPPLFLPSLVSEVSILYHADDGISPKSYSLPPQKRRRHVESRRTTAV
jgi:hypothetical protein